MMGNDEMPGIMMLTLIEIFNQIHQLPVDRRFSVSVSYVEIYNEHIRDLLDESKKDLPLREDRQRGTVVAGVTERKVDSSDGIIDILREGSSIRTEHATGVNEHSSRSHAVLQIKVTHRSGSGLRTGKLSLVDLAGSERASRTGNKGDRLAEGAAINRSLLSLANCINALCQQKKRRGVHVPYRDSKLTRLLKDSLGGNCMTCMIANVSPASVCTEETFNTLVYAGRARNIKSKATVGKVIAAPAPAAPTNNEADKDDEIARLKARIAELERENGALVTKVATLEARGPGPVARRDSPNPTQPVRRMVIGPAPGGGGGVNGQTPEPRSASAMDGPKPTQPDLQLIGRGPSGAHPIMFLDADEIARKMPPPAFNDQARGKENAPAGPRRQRQSAVPLQVADLHRAQSAPRSPTTKLPAAPVRRGVSRLKAGAKGAARGRVSLAPLSLEVNTAHGEDAHAGGAVTDRGVGGGVRRGVKVAVVPRPTQPHGLMVGLAPNPYNRPPLGRPHPQQPPRPDTRARNLQRERSARLRRMRNDLKVTMKFEELTNMHGQLPGAPIRM